MRLTNRQFADLLRRAGTLAAKKASIQQELTAAFRDRYGQTYSDVDADQIIDVLDYAGGSLTLAECDEEMARSGAPILPETGE